MSARKTNFTFGLLQGTYWMSYCILFPFLVKMCSSMGYNDFYSGIILTGATLANLLMQPVMGSLCDRLLRIKPLFVISFITGGIISLLLYFGKDHFIILLAAVILISACIQSLQYIIDIWSVRVSLAGSELNYGFSRSFGSVFYAVTAMVFGRILDSFGMMIIIPVFIICCFITAGIAMLINENDAAVYVMQKRKNEPQKEKVSLLGTAKILVRNKKYMIFLISYFILSIGNLPLFNYMARKFEILGAGNSLYGIGLLCMAMSEVPGLVSLNRIKAYVTPQNIVMLSLGGMIIRGILFGFVMDPVWLAISMLSQSISYGLFIGGLILYMSEIVEPKILFSAQTIFAAVSIGVSGFIGNLAGGYFADLIGVIPMMKYCLIFITAGALLFIISALPEMLSKKRNA